VQASLAAGLKSVTPDTTDSLSAKVTAPHLGAISFDRTYSVTTPSGEDFAFSVVASRFGNTGETKVSVAHASDGGVAPSGSADSLTQAGLRIDAPGVDNTGAWINVT